MSEMDFSNVIEPILLLDTINRICFDMVPYNLKQKNNSNEEQRNLDENEVPPIQVQKKHGNIVFEKDKHNPFMKTVENFYPRLT